MHGAVVIVRYGLIDAAGQARAARTRIGGALTIMKIEAEGVPIDDSEHMAKAAVRRATKRERQEVRMAKYRLERAEAAFKLAQEELERAKR